MTNEINVETMQAIFVGGQSRSGTTLLQGQICNSPATIETTGECVYLRYLIETYAAMQTGDYALHTQDYFDSDAEKRAFQQRLLNVYFENIRDRFGDKIPVQKEPTMMGYFPETAALIPNAVFLATFRDPRDIFTSDIRRWIESGKGNEIDYTEWKKFQFARLIRMMHQSDKVKGRFFYVRYESLCANPERCLNELNAHLNEKGYDLKLNEQAHDTSWLNKRDGKFEASASKLDGKPVSTSSIGNYKSQLPENVLETMKLLDDWLKKTTGIDWFCADNMDNIEDYPAVIAL